MNGSNVQKSTIASHHPMDEHAILITDRGEEVSGVAFYRTKGLFKHTDQIIDMPVWNEYRVLIGQIPQMVSVSEV